MAGICTILYMLTFDILMSEFEKKLFVLQTDLVGTWRVHCMCRYRFEYDSTISRPTLQERDERNRTRA